MASPAGKSAEEETGTGRGGDEIMMGRSEQCGVHASAQFKAARRTLQPEP